MGRAPKKGLDFFKKSTMFYDDDRIIDLMEEYGPLGVTIYEIVLTLVYKNGYYLELDVVKLAKLVKRTIGSRWIKDIDRVLQVIDYCADIGLFDLSLLRQDIITSEGIQRRYAEICARNKVDKSRFWLLENQEASDDAVPEKISATEMQISVTETQISVAETQQEKEEDKIRIDIFNSDSSTDDIEQDVLYLLKDEVRANFCSTVERYINTYWCRAVNQYDLKQAAGALYILFLKKRKSFKEFNEEHLMLLEEALMIAADSDAKKWSYVRGIFRKWGDSKVFTYDDFVRYNEKAERKTKASSRYRR